MHLDALFWKPGWVATPPDEWEARQRLELAADSWIAEAQFDDVLVDWFREARHGRLRRRISASVPLARGSPSAEPTGWCGTPAGSEPGPTHKALVKFVRNQWHYRTSVRKQVLAELEREEEAAGWSSFGAGATPTRS